MKLVLHFLLHFNQTLDKLFVKTWKEMVNKMFGSLIKTCNILTYYNGIMRLEFDLLIMLWKSNWK